VLFKRNKLYRRESIFSIALLILGFSVLLSINVVIGLSWYFSYAEIVAWRISKTPDFHDIWAEHYLPYLYKDYVLARFTSVGLCFFLLSGSVYLKFNYGQVLMCLEDLYILLEDEIKQSFLYFKKIKKVERVGIILLFIVSISLRIFHFSFLPIQIDELMSYYYFVEKGPLLTAIYYPFPNNHVLFNLLFSFFASFINDPILAGRIVSAIAFHLLLIILFFGLLRYFKNSKIALMAVACCIFFFSASVYAAEARGYALLSLFTVIAAFALFLYLEKNKTPALAVFVLASIAGAYTVPVFLIPFLAMVCFWSWAVIRAKNWKSLKTMTLCIASVGAGVLFLYSPILLFSGVSPIIANEWVKPDDSPFFFSYIFPVASAEILSFFSNTDMKGWVYFMVFGVLGSIFFIKADDRYRKWMVLTLFMFLMIFLFVLINRRFMFHRTITYVSYFIYPALAIILFYCFKAISKNPRVVNALVVIVMALTPMLSYFQYNYNIFEPLVLNPSYYEPLEAFLQKAIKYNEKVHVVVSEDFGHVNLYTQYLREYKGLAISDDLSEANFVLIEKGRILGESKEMHNHLLYDSAKSIVSYPPDLLFYERVK
jgi:hypothetical protein